MRKRSLSLSLDERVELEHLRDRDPRPYLRECAAALLKIADGHSARDVALHGLHRPRKPDTVYSWLDRYREGGAAGLVHKPRGHRGFSPSPGRISP